MNFNLSHHTFSSSFISTRERETRIYPFVYFNIIPSRHLLGRVLMQGGLTGHVHHPTVAQSQDLIGLAEQAAGTDAVCVVSRELLFAGGAAVPPGLGQVGQLNTEIY